MSLHSFLITAFAFLATAVIFTPLFKRFGLGSILGYMAAGAAIGPWGLEIVEDVKSVSSYAELGVVFLLFVIGLELQPRRLWSLRTKVFGLGSLQVFVTAAVLVVALKVLGWPWSTAAICAFALSLSSTAFALQIMAEKNVMKTEFGQTSFSILLFQDLAAIPFLAIIPLLVKPDSVSDLSIFPVLRVLGVIALVILAGRFLLRPVMRIIATTGVREVFTSAALMLVIGMALVMELQGLSMALGSFLGGMVLAESEYRHEMEANIEPFKGLLLGLFFISVGMAVDFGLILSEFHIILAAALALMFVKALVIVGLGRAFKMSWQPAGNMGIILAQAGEFGFVIFAIARQGGAISDAQENILIAIVTMSMVLTPLFVEINERFVKPLFNESAPEFDNIQDDSPQVIIAGFGRVGQMTGRLLRVLWIPFTALELDAEQVEVLRKFGNKVYYGDASRTDLLEAAGAAKAEIFVLAVDAPEMSIQIAKTVKEHFPHLKIIARARNRQHVFDLMKVGVTDIFRETFASSLEMAHMVLDELGMPEAKSAQTIKTFREHDENNLVRQYEIWDNDDDLVAYAKEAASQLEKTLQADA